MVLNNLNNYFGATIVFKCNDAINVATEQMKWFKTLLINDGVKRIKNLQIIGHRQEIIGRYHHKSIDIQMQL